MARAGQPYSTMPLQDLAKLPISSCAARDAVIFMWITDANLAQGMWLMDAWGFEYKTIAFIWVKICKDGKTPRMGGGKWTRKESEICILGTRGKPRRLSAGVRQVIMEPRREHSRKPDAQYRRIEELVDGPYAECFARQRRAGWHQIFSDEPDKYMGVP